MGSFKQGVIQFTVALRRLIKRPLRIIEWGPGSTSEAIRQTEELYDSKILVVCEESQEWESESLYPYLRIVTAPYTDLCCAPQRWSKGRIQDIDVAIVTNGDLRSFHFAEKMATHFIGTTMHRYKIYEYTSWPCQVWSRYGGFLAKQDWASKVLDEEDDGVEVEVLGLLNRKTLERLAKNLGIRVEGMSTHKLISAIRSVRSRL